jgi:hypothetical protein
MKKIILLDRPLGGCKNANTVTVDSTEFLNFSKEEEFLAAKCKVFLNSIAEKRVENQTILEWFRYKDISLWWFVYRRVWPKIEECIRFIENLKKMIEDLRPDTLVVEGFFDKLDIIKQICATHNIKVIVPIRLLRKSLFKSILKRKLWRLVVYKYNKKSRQKKAERITLSKGEIGSDFKVNPTEDCVIYLAAGNYRKEIYDWSEGKVISGEHIVQGILEGVRNKKNLLCIDVEYNYLSDTSTLKERLADKNQYWIPFEILITPKLQKECENSINTVINSITTLFKKKEFQNALLYEDTNLWPSVELVFKTILAEIYIPNYILSIEAAKHSLSKIKPKSILLPYETGIYAMAMIVAADELGIRSFGIQHGIIHKSHFDYSINNLKITQSSLGCPIPTFLLVFGEYYRKLLVETFSYPHDRVKVVGNPVYDSHLINLTSAYKEKIFSLFDLDPSRRTVLVATSMLQAIYGREPYDVLIVKSLVESFSKKGNEIQVVIKTHPTEDPSAYLKIVAEQNASNFFVVEDFPIQPLIAICDIFVAVLSTTIFEAMVMNKPVIIPQASKKIHRDVMSIGEAGAAILVSFNELPQKILQVLGDPRISKELSIKSSEVVKYHFNFPTGDVSARLAEMLTSN